MVYYILIKLLLYHLRRFGIPEGFLFEKEDLIDLKNVPKEYMRTDIRMTLDYEDDFKLDREGNPHWVIQVLGCGSEFCYYVPESGIYHFTIDKDLPGRDNKFAILPNDLLELSRFKNNLEAMDKNQGLDLQKCEQEVYLNARGRWSK